MNKIALAPTSLSNTPPLEYVDAAARAGYDGIGIRLFRSPGIEYAFFPVTDNPSLMRDVKSAVVASGMEVIDILSFYMQPEMDIESMRAPLQFGAELGGQYALVIGDDPDWGRMCGNFAAFCEAASAVGLKTALEAPVTQRQVNTLPKALQLIEDSGRDDAVLCIDPYQYFRAGHAPDLLKQVDPRLLPYTQITDGVAEPAPGGRRGVGRGDVPLKEILDALPPGLPLSLEWGPGRSFEGSAADWAKHALEATRGFLEQYYAERA